MSDMPLPGHRRGAVTAQLQTWLGLAASPLAAAGMLATSRGESAALPQILTLGRLAGGASLRLPVLAVGAIGHAALSAGDFAHAGYAALSALRVGTRRHLLLNGHGPAARIYEPIGGGCDGS